MPSATTFESTADAAPPPPPPTPDRHRSRSTPHRARQVRRGVLRGRTPPSPHQRTSVSTTWVYTCPRHLADRRRQPRTRRPSDEGARVPRTGSEGLGGRVRPGDHLPD